MEKQLINNGYPIRYKILGEGQPIFLLHGYLEAIEIWHGFDAELAKNYLVVALDLPGHGKSTCWPQQSMQHMAQTVDAVREAEGLTAMHVVGHSMGGYVALAYLDAYKQHVKSICLLHAHPFADPTAVLEKRSREIKLVKEGKKELIANANIPNAFATDNLERRKSEIEQAKAIARATPADGIIACLHAMMHRHDSSTLWSTTTVPALLVVGKKDNYINSTTIERIKMPKKGETVYLCESGHQSFIEERPKCVQALANFFEQANK